MTRLSRSYVCSHCKTEQTYELSEEQSAFVDTYGIRLRCEACGVYRDIVANIIFFDIDPDTLDQWLFDERLIFLEQDEDLVLSGIPQSELERAYDIAPSQDRREMIVDAIAVKMYDRSFSSTEERLACKKWLRGNQHVWREGRVAPYISEAIVKRLNLQ